MWAPSFLSVLYDLWRFFWRLDPPIVHQTRPSQRVESQPVLQPIVQTIDVAPLVPQSVKLCVDEFYTAESIETILVRQALATYDKHLVQSGNLTLIEWLLYYVQQQNHSVSLLALRMTPLGMWHQTVKGLPGVRVGIEPYTGALMEWFDTARVGRVGLVERVTPDATVTVRTLSVDPSGTYLEQIYTAATWKELGAVFTRFRV